MFKILSEAVVVGIILLVVGRIIMGPVDFLKLFVTGFAVHFLCEVSGINKWYCKNGAACKKA